MSTAGTFFGARRQQIADIQGYVWVAVLSTLYLWLFVRVQWHIGDEGDMLNGALAVTQGHVPYRDFHDLRGPGSFYWLGLFFELFGATWVVARVHLLATGVASSLLVYYLTTRVYRGPDAVMPCALVTVLSVPFWPASHHHWDSNLFALAAVAAFCRWQDCKALHWLIASGILAGLASCFIYQKGFLLLMSFLAVLGVSRIWFSADVRIRREASVLLAGYTMVGLVVLAWFAHLGAIQDFVDSTIRSPATTYVDANRVPYAFMLTGLAGDGLNQLGTMPSWLAPTLGGALMIPLLLIAALPVLVIALTGAWLVTRQSTAVVQLPHVTYGVIGFALWFSEFHRKDIFHLIYGCPILLIALLLVWSSVDRPRAVRILVPWGLGLALLFLGVSRGLRAGGAHERIVTRRGTILVEQDDAALRFLLSDAVAPGDYVFVYPYYSTYYFLADVRNPTRFGQMMYGPGSEPYFDEAIASLQAKQVRYVLWDSRLTGVAMKTWFPTYQGPPNGEGQMERYFRELYRQIDMLSGFRLLERR